MEAKAAKTNNTHLYHVFQLGRVRELAPCFSTKGTRVSFPSPHRKVACMVDRAFFDSAAAGQICCSVYSNTESKYFVYSLQI
jgi:hypothetical protein